MLPLDVEAWCARIRLLRTFDAELSVGTGSRVETIARVLVANEVNGVGDLVWAEHPATWVNAAALRKTEVKFLEALISRCVPLRPVSVSYMVRPQVSGSEGPSGGTAR